MRKIKFVTTLFSMFLAIASLTFGVYSMTETKMNVSIITSYNPAEYNISYMTQGGTLDEEYLEGGIYSTYSVASNYSLPTSQNISNNGYAFVGWTKNVFDIYEAKSSAYLINGNKLSVVYAADNMNGGYDWTIPVYENQTYTIKATLENGAFRPIIQLYNSADENISSAELPLEGHAYNSYYVGYYNNITATKNSYSFEIPSGVSYIKLAFAKMSACGEGNYNIASDIKFFQGTTEPTEEFVTAITAGSTIGNKTYRAIWAEARVDFNGKSSYFFTLENAYNYVNTLVTSDSNRALITILTENVGVSNTLTVNEGNCIDLTTSVATNISRDTGFTGQLVLNNGTTSIDGSNNKRITFNGNSNSTSELIHSIGDLTLTYVNVTNNDTHLGSSDAGIDTLGGSLYLDNVNVSNIVSLWNGAGLSAVDTDVKIYNSSFESCEIQTTGGRAGAAIYLDGSELYFENSSILDCYVQSEGSGMAGAIAVYNSSTAQLVSGHIQNCGVVGAAVNAGAIMVSNSDITIGDMEIHECSVTSNSSTIRGGTIATMGTGDLTINGATIYDSKLTTNNSYETHGGAIYIGTTGTNTISNLTLYGCSAEGGSKNYGGAIYIASSSITVTISDTTLRGTTTLDGTDLITNASHGGAIYNAGKLTILDIDISYFKASYGGAIYNAGWMDLNDAIISNNTATSDGGAIYSSETATYTGIYTSYIENNTAANGGAVYVDTSEAEITLSETHFRENSCTTSGGTVYLSSDAEIADCSIRQSSAINGGAIFINKQLSINGVTNIENNTATYGGAIYNSGALNISGDTTISNNTASTSGGAIYTSGHVSIESVTISGNSAATAGAIYGNNAEVDFDGGQIIGNTGSTGVVCLENSSTLNMTAGTLGSKESMNSGNYPYILNSDSTMIISGGNVYGSLQINGGSSLDISGGTVSTGYDYYWFAYLSSETSILNISGSPTLIGQYIANTGVINIEGIPTLIFEALNTKYLTSVDTRGIVNIKTALSNIKYGSNLNDTSAVASVSASNPIKVTGENVGTDSNTLHIVFEEDVNADLYEDYFDWVNEDKPGRLKAPNHDSDDTNDNELRLIYAEDDVYEIVFDHNENLLLGGGLTTSEELASWIGNNNASLTTEEGKTCIKIDGVLGQEKTIRQNVLNYFENGATYNVSAEIKLVNYVAGTDPYVSLYYDGNHTVNGSSKWFGGNYFLHDYNNQGWVKISTTYTPTDINNPTAFRFWIYARDFTGTLYVRDVNFSKRSEDTETIISQQYGGTLELPNPDPTDAGYTFNGWFTKPIGGEQVTTSTKVPDVSTRYFAQWTANKYDIEYDSDGGTPTPATEKVTFGGTITLPDAITLEDHIFAGWQCSEDDVIYAANSAFTLTYATNVIMTAVWEVDPDSAEAKVEFDNETTYYLTLEDAFIYANSLATTSSKKAVITILKSSVGVGSTLTVNSGKYIDLTTSVATNITRDSGFTSQIMNIGGTSSIYGVSGKVITFTGDSNTSRAIYISGTLDISYAKITGFTTQYGAGLYASTSSKLTLNNVDVINNNSTKDGGGIYTEGTLVIINTKISGNTAANTGGGIRCSALGSIQLNGALITNNTAGTGGGVYTAGTLTIEGGTSISENQASSSGSGIYAYNTTIDMTGGAINDNKVSSSTYGSAMYLNSCTFNMSGGEILGNERVASFYGAIYTASSTINLTGGTIGSSESTNGGYCEYIFNTSSAVTIDGTSIYGAIQIGSESSVEILSGTVSANDNLGYYLNATDAKLIINNSSTVILGNYGIANKGVVEIKGTPTIVNPTGILNSKYKVNDDANGIVKISTDITNIKWGTSVANAGAISSINQIKLQGNGIGTNDGTAHIVFEDDVDASEYISYFDWVTSTHDGSLYADGNIIRLSHPMSVTIDPNGGTWNGNTSSTTTTHYANQLNYVQAPTREGYTFAGWSGGDTVLTPVALNNDAMTFDGSDYIDLGRNYMYEDKIFISAEAYMPDWSQFTSIKFASCTESGGWGFTTSGGKASYVMFQIMDAGTKSYKTLSASMKWVDLSSGWHTFTASFDGTYARLYVDGVLEATSAAFTGKIGYHASNSILIGAEPGASNTPTGGYFTGKIRNVYISNTGWFEQMKFSSPTDTISNSSIHLITSPESYTLTAQWETGSYDVVVDPNGGSYNGSTGETTLNQGFNTLLPIAAPTRTSYSFAGWSGGETILTPIVLNNEAMTFDGSSDYIDLGTSYKYTDKIFISVEAYMADWSTLSYAKFLSCTQGGGWSFTGGASSKVTFQIRDAGIGSGYVYLYGTMTYASLSSGWHTFSVSFDGTYAKLFVDGALQDTSDAFTGGIGYHASNSIIAGAEAGTGNTAAGSYFTGKLRNIYISNYGFSGDYVAFDNPTDSISYSALHIITSGSNVELTASWAAPNEYTITYKDGDSVIDSQSSAVDADVTLASAPTKTGYTFTGWLCDYNGEEYYANDTFTMPAENVTMTAQWTINSYTITYSDGTEVTAEYGEEVTLESAPTQTGYTFTGWKSSSDNNTYSAGETFIMPAEDVTMTAQWTVNSYTITYSDGTEITADYGEEVTLESALTKTGHTFAGWKSSSDSKTYSAGATFTMPDSDVTMTEQWSVNTYTVTLIKGNGISAVTGEGTYDYGADVTITATVNSGYTWENWTGYKSTTTKDYSFTMPDSDVTFTANATINTGSVTINPNGGSYNGSTSTTVVSQTYNTLYPVSTPIRTGYTFTGWSGGNTVLTPVALNNEAMIFDGSSDYVDLGTSYKYTDKIFISVEAYMADWSKLTSAKFLSCTESGGWSFTGSATSKVTFQVRDAGVGSGYVSLKGSMTYASLSSGWHTFSVSFDGTYAKLYIDGVLEATSEAFTGKIGYNSSNSIIAGAEAGTGSTADGSYFNGKLRNIYISNYGFSGDYVSFDNPTDTTNYSALHIMSADTAATLTAQWTINSYTITYSAGTEITVDYGEEVTLASAPTKAGYTFTGWMCDYNGQTYSAGETFTMPAENVTMTAQWNISTYTITYNANGGESTLPNEQTVSYNVSIKLASAMTRTGYTFTGWLCDYNSQTYSAGSSFKMPAENVTMIAQWNINTYTITYNANGGNSTPTSQTADYESLISLSPGIKKNGYKFTGWKSSLNNEIYSAGESFAIPASNVTMTAQWVETDGTIRIETWGFADAYDGLDLTYTAGKDNNSITGDLWSKIRENAGAFADVTMKEFGNYYQHVYSSQYEAYGAILIPSTDKYRNANISDCFLGFYFNPNDAWKQMNNSTDSDTGRYYLAIDPDNFEVPEGTTGEITLYAMFDFSNNAYVDYKYFEYYNAYEYLWEDTFSEDPYNEYSHYCYVSEDYQESSKDTPTLRIAGYSNSNWLPAYSDGYVLEGYRIGGVNDAFDNGYTWDDFHAYGMNYGYGSYSIDYHFDIWYMIVSTVTLDANGGTGGTSSIDIPYGYSHAYTSIVNPTLTGYTFDGWTSSAGNTVIDTNGDLVNDGTYVIDGLWAYKGNCTLIASWVRNGIPVNTYFDNTVATNSISLSGSSGEGNNRILSYATIAEYIVVDFVGLTNGFEASLISGSTTWKAYVSSSCYIYITYENSIYYISTWTIPDSVTSINIYLYSEVPDSDIDITYQLKTTNTSSVEMTSNIRIDDGYGATTEDMNWLLDDEYDLTNAIIAFTNNPSTTDRNALYSFASIKNGASLGYGISLVLEDVGFGFDMPILIWDDSTYSQLVNAGYALKDLYIVIILNPTWTTNEIISYTTYAQFQAGSSTYDCTDATASLKGSTLTVSFNCSSYSIYVVNPEFYISTSEYTTSTTKFTPSVTNSGNKYTFTITLSASTNPTLAQIQNATVIYLNGTTGGAGVAECFVAGTQVTTVENYNGVDYDVSTKNIEDINVGDYVLSYNEATGENQVARVKDLVIKTDKKDFAKLVFSDGSTVTMTQYHPLLTLEGWKSLTNFNGYETLEVGDKVKTENGYKEITSIDMWTEEDYVICYNLGLETLDGEYLGYMSYYANGTLAQSHIYYDGDPLLEK